MVTLEFLSSNITREHSLSVHHLKSAINDLQQCLLNHFHIIDDGDIFIFQYSEYWWTQAVRNSAFKKTVKVSPTSALSLSRLSSFMHDCMVPIRGVIRNLSGGGLLFFLCRGGRGAQKSPGKHKYLDPGDGRLIPPPWIRL